MVDIYTPQTFNTDDPTTPWDVAAAAKMGNGIATAQADANTAIAAAAAAAAAAAVLPTTRQVGGSFALPASDAFNYVEYTGSGLCLVTINSNTTTAIPIGALMTVLATASGGVVQFVAGSGVSFLAPYGTKTAAVGADLYARKRGADLWLIGGAAST